MHILVHKSVFRELGIREFSLHFHFRYFEVARDNKWQHIFCYVTCNVRYTGRPTLILGGSFFGHFSLNARAYKWQNNV